MNTAVSTRRATAIAFHEEFDKRSAEFSAILPQDVPLAEFKRVTMYSIAMNPRLLQCTQVSVFRALTDAARNGWVPDGRDCYIDIRENFKTKELSAICIPGKHGYLKNFIGKTLKDWRAHVVRRGDDYDVELGDNEHFTHKVDPFAEGGSDDDIIGAYSIAIGMDGRVVSRAFMSLAQLLKARAKSASWSNERARPYSPWTTHFEEMCEKTVMKRHADRLPKEAKASAILAAEREIEAENEKLLAEPQKLPRKSKKTQTRQLEDLGKSSNAEPDEWNGHGGVKDGGQNSQNAPSAEPTMDTRDGSQTKTESSKATSDASRGQQKRGPGRPRKEEAQQKAQQPAEQPQTQARSNGGGDPINDAMEAGEAAYEAGVPRTGSPREYQSEDRWDLLDAWLEGWDRAADDSAGRALS